MTTVIYYHRCFITLFSGDSHINQSSVIKRIVLIWLWHQMSDAIISKYTPNTSDIQRQFKYRMVLHKAVSLSVLTNQLSVYRHWNNSHTHTHTYPECAEVSVLRLAALRSSLSSVLTMWAKRGRALRSLSQHSSISWWRTAGQSIGGGSL